MENQISRKRLCNRLLWIKFIFVINIWKMKRTSILDLARLLSLNPSTISRALNGHPDISDETRERVRTAAATFQYRPNLQARYFRNKNSGLIALILPEMNMFFVPGLMNGVNEALKNSDKSVIIFISDNDPEREKEIIGHCLSWMVEGVLISLSDSTNTLSHLMPLKEAGIPVLLLDKIIESPDFSTLSIDDSDAARLAVTHLTNKGLKAILGIFGHENLIMTRQRMDGFKDALHQSNISFSGYDTLPLNTQDNFEQNLENRLRSTPYDALFVMSDELLMLSLPVIQKLQLYPASLKIVCISDGTLPHRIYPPVTHILHSGFDIGKSGAILLLEMMKGQTITFHKKLSVSLQIAEPNP